MGKGSGIYVEFLKITDRPNCVSVSYLSTACAEQARSLAGEGVTKNSIYRLYPFTIPCNRSNSTLSLRDVTDDVVLTSSQRPRPHSSAASHTQYRQHQWRIQNV